MQKSVLVAALIGALIAAGVTHADVIAPSMKAAPESGTWLVWGGATRLHLNPDALDRFGITISDVTGASARVAGLSGHRYDVLTFPAKEASTLEVNHTGRKVDGLGGGALRHGGGLVLHVKGRTIDLRGFSLTANAPSRVGMALRDANGTVWLTGDHAHPSFDRNNAAIFTMREMNLRLSRAFAEALGDASLEGYEIGGLDFRAEAHDDGVAALDGGECSYTWPAPGLNTDIQLVYRDGNHNWDGHDDTIQVQRCSLAPPDGNDCSAGSTTGGVVIDQDSSLRNVGETAVTWHYMMSGDYPPYDNDQHPFLIWNLYRMDADGRIKQVGVSGLKHAFETINYACSCVDDQVIFPGCEDTYAVYNNDESGVLGPRSELIPNTAVWGRCGSVFDTNCDGREDDGGITDSLYDHRMVVTESDMLPPASTGARYFFEYWYVVRDDQDIYNTMGYREISPHKNAAGAWSVSMVDNVPPGNNFVQGPLVNRWVDPVSPPANADNEELSTPNGRARVAVKATDLGDGTWRYEYAVMNFDYTHPHVDPAHPNEPDLKLLANHGFKTFSVPVGSGATVSAMRADDADLDASNDWTATSADGTVTFSAPADANSLDWGTLYHFEFVADTPPAAGGSVHLVGVATSSEPEQPFDLAMLAPQPKIADDTIFAGSFD